MCIPKACTAAQQFCQNSALLVHCPFPRRGHIWAHPAVEQRMLEGVLAQDAVSGSFCQAYAALVGAGKQLCNMPLAQMKH